LPGFKWKYRVRIRSVVRRVFDEEVGGGHAKGVLLEGLAKRGREAGPTGRRNWLELAGKKRRHVSLQLTIGDMNRLPKRQSYSVENK